MAGQVSIMGERSYFYISDEVGLVEPQQNFFAKHEIKSFMLYMSIGQYVIVVAMEHPSQNLAVYLILTVYIRVFLIHSEQLDHVKTSFRLIQRNCKHVQPLVVVFGGKHRQVSVEDFYYKFWDIGSFPFLLFRLLDEKWQHSIEWLDQLSRVEHYPLSLALRCGKFGLDLLARRVLEFRLLFERMRIYTFCGLGHQSQYLFMPIYLHTPYNIQCFKVHLTKGYCISMVLYFISLLLAFFAQPDKAFLLDFSHKSCLKDTFQACFLYLVTQKYESLKEHY